MGQVSNQDWLDFQNIIEQDAGEDFFTHDIIWKRSVQSRDRFGEDKNVFTDIPLKCLISYNDPRTWPVTITTESGAIDKQSMQVFFLKKTFEAGGYLIDGGYPAIDPEMDRWVVDGLVYKCMGDSHTSQIKTKDLLFFIILKREETPTGTFR